MAKKRKNAAKTEKADEIVEASKTAAPESVVDSTASTDLINDRQWFGGAVLVTLLATFLRFYDLALKPLHHDEGVNGFFLKNLIHDGLYKYDPANYHGPTLYYISLAFSKAFGMDTIPVRASVAIFGVLMVVLVLYLKRYIGRTGSLLAALFVALSPGMVFISRYFIHEISFVFLSIAIVVSVVFFIEKKEAGYGAVAWMALILLVCFLPSALNLATAVGGESEGTVWALRIGFLLVEAGLAYFVIRMLLSWDGGRPIYLILAAACISLFFATKETAFITLGTMAIACVSVAIWRKIWPASKLDQRSMRIVLAAHAFLIVSILFYNAELIDGFKWIYNTIAYNPFRPPETFVFGSIIFLTVGAVAAWIMFVLEMRRSNESQISEPVELTLGNFRKSLGNNSNAIIIVSAAAIVAAYLFVLFFSSFFTYKEGIWKAFEAYAIWNKTGNRDHTMHGYLGYVKWGLKIESAILILSTLGILITFLKARHRFAMFIGLWGLGLFAAYSIIPYKTPWLALSFLLPMCISAGYGLGQLIESKRLALKLAAAILTAAGCLVLTYQMYQLNFVRYDDDEMVYVYAHTRRGFLDMMREVEKYADRSGKGKDATIEIVSPDYWPMTWYTKDYTHANYFGSLVDATTSEIVIMKKNDQDVAAIQKYSSHYKYVGVYPLRPGVNLVLLVRNDLAEPGDQDMNKILEYKTVPGYTN
ncbi:MAG: phospholipid carrier-dependent glycosyltransferase [Pyrinomonadaceae bacterium]